MKKTTNNKQAISVSVIIPTRNSSLTLPLLFKSINKQSVKPLEVIVVDNDSTDDTAAIAKKNKAIVYKKGPERSTQKNYGAKKAKGTHLLFLDSDVELAKLIIAECVNLARDDFKAVIIPEKIIGDGYWTRAKALERRCHLGDDSIECPWFYSKKTFIKLKGYNESMYAGEDWDLFNKLKLANYKFTRSKSKISHHIGRIKLWKYLKKKRYYGYNLKQYIKLNNSSVLNKVPFARLAYIKKLPLLLKNLHLAIGILIIKILEMTSITIGMMQYIIRKDKTAEKNYYG